MISSSLWLLCTECMREQQGYFPHGAFEGFAYFFIEKIHGGNRVTRRLSQKGEIDGARCQSKQSCSHLFYSPAGKNVRGAGTHALTHARAHALTHSHTHTHARTHARTQSAAQGGLANSFCDGKRQYSGQTKGMDSPLSSGFLVAGKCHSLGSKVSGMFTPVLLW